MRERERGKHDGATSGHQRACPANKYTLTHTHTIFRNWYRIREKIVLNAMLLDIIYIPHNTQ